MLRLTSPRSDLGHEAADTSIAFQIRQHSDEGVFRRKVPEPGASPVNAGDRHELGGAQARAADERAIDVFDRQQFRGVGRPHRAAIENAHAGALPRQMLVHPVTDEAVHLGDVSRRGRKTRADRPDRLVGNDNLSPRRIFRNRTRQLHADDRQGVACFPRCSRFADANDRREPRAQRRLGLGANDLIGFVVAAAALRMAKDHIARAGILEHFGGNIAGEGAVCLGMAILAAEPDWGAFANRRNGHEQGRRGTNDNFRLSRDARGDGLANRGRFAEAFAQTVHLPITRDEGA
jgi:hypothetical protein